MFSWFRKKAKKAVCPCRHYKQAGEKPLVNMVEVIRFTPYKKMDHDRDYPFGVKQCSGCGKRAFSAGHLHLMGTHVTDEIDKFIAYEITLDQLTVFFDELGYKYEVKQ